jgi:hypothetical protein
MNDAVERANKLQVDYLKEEKRATQHLFEQTAGLLANIIDTKENYTMGRAKRIAGYAKEIAILAGKEEKECEEIYYAALLHDVGKLEIPDAIITKEGSLNDEEVRIMHDHADIGGDLLAEISEYPYLSIGARYHHERYDGNGYPKGLRGDIIPEAARIISIADAYYNMTSKKPYRDALPQRTVREEFIKGAGTQFDPEYARIMVDMIDNDTEYLMKESSESEEETINIANGAEIHFEEYKEVVTDGIKLSANLTKVHFDVMKDSDVEEKMSLPTIILFSSYDGCVHNDDTSIRVLNYVEYGEIWLDGHIVSTAARNMTCEEFEVEVNDNKYDTIAAGVSKYVVEAVKVKDHVRIIIRSEKKNIYVIAALPDAGSEVYIGFTGEHCRIMNTSVSVSDEEVDERNIPRIAEEISYINRLEGDIPNVQVDGNRTAYAAPLPVIDGMRLMFHSMSLPTATLIWNCPSVVLYSSEDGVMYGHGYRELACIRLDGENSSANRTIENEMVVKKGEDFQGWDAWKKTNKIGIDCQIDFRRTRNKVIIGTENAGISIKNSTVIPDNLAEIYVSLTGDQCALTDIRVV